MPIIGSHFSVVSQFETLPIFPLTEAAALAYGDIISTAIRQGRPMSAPDGMIAAIARINGAQLATRNVADFATTGLSLTCPWDF